MDVLRAEEPVDAGAVQAWRHEAEVGREAGDGVGEEIVEREGDGELAPALLRQRELAGGGAPPLLLCSAAGAGAATWRAHRWGGWPAPAAAPIGPRQRRIVSDLGGGSYWSRDGIERSRQ